MLLLSSHELLSGYNSHRGFVERLVPDLKMVEQGRGGNLFMVHIFIEILVAISVVFVDNITVRIQVLIGARIWAQG